MNSAELSSQLRKPTGANGLEIAEALNDSNKSLYELTFEMIAPESGHHLLEIGFGNGKHFPKYFEKEQNLQLTGVDFSKDMCQAARQLNASLIETGKLTIHCDETSSLPFPEAHFDMAIALNVIYFLDPPETHLREIHRVLKPNGLFLIGYRPRHTVEHLDFTKQGFTLYEANELISLLENNGFQIVKEQNQVSSKTSVEGKEVTVKDACLLVKKIAPTQSARSENQ
ncbi:class I SAM-dependent methyltransferase [Gracilimonas mengyeensis]|uniref:Methyltransferase domain-containing protein n=1 Tax=Gracilimonas mengyeensis TaxID=1302730 RepID=A0A521FD40_9BACT|nr:class I SAM-dependent methyltransferase [Gracilimonas mengyeensis]SMO94102.1 Methyltransferase domain-containing protein [Gracilimonas mengyeensis]